MTTPTYHLWLKPSGAAYDRLALAIRDLSAKLNAPIFEPHVTLLSRLKGTEEEHRRRTKQLAQLFHPFSIILTEPVYQDAYFQCVFLKARKTSHLMEARRQARQIFNSGAGKGRVLARLGRAGCDDGGYMPHLSLLYGLYPADLKRELAASLSSDLQVTFEATAVYLLRSDSDDPKDWHEIAAAPLNAG